MSSTATQKVFREAIQPNGGNSSSLSSSKNSYEQIFHKILHSPIGWSVITFIVIFVVLYFLNPPIVQNKKQENEMTKPTVNPIIVLVISAVAGIIVYGYTRWHA